MSLQSVSYRDTNWFPVLTLRGTVTASQDAPSIEKINVDQFDAAIGISTEAGDFNFEAQLPSELQMLQMVKIQEVLGTGTSPLTATSWFRGNLDGSLYDMSVLIQDSYQRRYHLPTCSS